MVREGDYVAVFHSVHRVLKAEKVLKAAAVDFRLIPAPRQISADCGLALSFGEGLRGTIENLLGEADLSIAELWVMRSGNYISVT